MAEFNSSIIPTMASTHDDLEEDDACSICLEPFCAKDPPTVTTCKHDYHLHCILEWSQRSKECPICWQTLALKDPVSQELLAAVEIERNARRKHVPTGGSTHSREHLEPGPHWTDDSDFNERIMQHLAAMMSRARQVHGTERHRSSEQSSSSVDMFQTRLSESSMHPNTPEECNSAYGSSGSSSPTPSISSVDVQPSLSPTPSLVNLSSGAAPRRAGHQSSRPVESQSPDSTQRPRSTELLAFSESIKSKLSAASARYKDSISKGTQGFREKLLARNDSVKKMSKGVQREMSASIAGVTRMIERLDLKSKQKSPSAEGVKRVGETSNLFSKGKGVLDNLIASSREDSVQADMHEKSQATGSISGR
ncbi:hypothetical protein RND81_05G145400 [Saponaria officinalis]|uniref:RING-type E3 ubiquitin transferase n=1 Tax=Saponaria officinalis TaxID=3572 RepID=A0AAW1L134_SAPOF